MLFKERLNSSNYDDSLRLFEKAVNDIKECLDHGYTVLSDRLKEYDLLIEEIDFKIFRGHSFQLAHYYRHLFLTVKFVVNQDEKLISYSEKRNYLRVLRAQLSNQEQAMLFYNWKSGFGNSWQNENNFYFTDYRMIHNIYNGLLFDDFDLDKIFDKTNVRKEKHKSNDHLFEYEAW